MCNIFRFSFCILEYRSSGRDGCEKAHTQTFLECHATFSASAISFSHVTIPVSGERFSINGSLEK